MAHLELFEMNVCRCVLQTTCLSSDIIHHSSPVGLRFLLLSFSHKHTHPEKKNVLTSHLLCCITLSSLLLSTMCERVMSGDINNRPSGCLTKTYISYNYHAYGGLKQEN